MRGARRLERNGCRNGTVETFYGMAMKSQNHPAHGAIRFLPSDLLCYSWSFALFGPVQLISTRGQLVVPQSVHDVVRAVDFDQNAGRSFANEAFSNTLLDPV